MAIWLTENNKVVVQGLTGKQGQFYGLMNRIRHQRGRRNQPEKGGTDCPGVPIFATRARSRRAARRGYLVHHRATALAKDAIIEPPTRVASSSSRDRAIPRKSGVDL